MTFLFDFCFWFYLFRTHNRRTGKMLLWGYDCMTSDWSLSMIFVVFFFFAFGFVLLATTFIFYSRSSTRWVFFFLKSSAILVLLKPTMNESKTIFRDWRWLNSLYETVPNQIVWRRKNSHESRSSVIRLTFAVVIYINWWVLASENQLIAFRYKYIELWWFAFRWKSALIGRNVDSE